MRSIKFKFEDINRGSIRETLDALAEALHKQHDLRLGFEGWHKSSPIHEEEFDQAFDWIRDRWSQKGGWSERCSSYTLKHICERDLKAQYCSNGTFIAACLFAGLTANIEPGVLVCTFTYPNAF